MSTTMFSWNFIFTEITILVMISGYDKIGSLHPVAKVIHCLLLQTLALPYIEYHLIVAN